MAYHEELAQAWAQEDCAVWQAKFAADYVRLIGVHPEQRLRLQAGLQNIAAGGGMSVAEWVEQVNHKAR